MEIGLLSKIYVVDHIREYYQDPKNLDKKYLDTKGIGNFCSLEKAKKVVRKYKSIKGFKDCPEGFRISEYVIDSIYNSFVNELIDIYSEKDKKKFSELFALYYVLEDEEGDEDVILLGYFRPNEGQVRHVRTYWLTVH